MAKSLCVSCVNKADKICYSFPTYFHRQGETISADRLRAVGSLIEPWFLFALVWSVGATCDGDSRKKFDRYLRERISEEKVCAVFTCAHMHTHLTVLLRMR